MEKRRGGAWPSRQTIFSRNPPALLGVLTAPNRPCPSPRKAIYGTHSACRTDPVSSASSPFSPASTARQIAPVGPRSNTPSTPSASHFPPTLPASLPPTHPPLSGVCICIPADPDPC